ncbi:MAG: septum formation initiator family protein [Flavobacteriaceae bacterium]|nr:septum formation initiator family protein [Flavobacteriaceae bacterium]
MKFSEIKNKRWVQIISNKYLLIVLIFIVWMLVFDTNSYLIHQELNSSIKKLENQKNTYQDEIKKDKVFIERMKDSNELEKFAREKYYLKKENEDIYIIENQDSLKTKKNE